MDIKNVLAIIIALLLIAIVIYMGRKYIESQRKNTAAVSNPLLGDWKAFLGITNLFAKIYMDNNQYYVETKTQNLVAPTFSYLDLKVTQLGLPTTNQNGIYIFTAADAQVYVFTLNGDNLKMNIGGVVYDMLRL